MGKNEVITALEIKQEDGEEPIVRLTITQPDTDEPTVHLVMHIGYMIKMLGGLVMDLQAVAENVLPSGPSLN